jgi:hypothetical protein
MTTIQCLCRAIVLSLPFFLLGCRATDEETTGLQTLHASTLSRVTNDRLSLAALFPDQHHLLLTDSLFNIRKLHLADLQSGTVKTIPIKPMNYFRLLPVGDGIIVDPGGADQTHQVLFVTPDGQTSQRASLDLNVLQFGNYAPIAAEAEQLDDLLQAGQLENLTEVQVILMSESGPLPPRPLAFLNDQYLIRINHANERDLPRLQAHSTSQYTLDYSEIADPTYPGLDIQVQRAPYHDLAGISDNRNIQKITISRDGQPLAEYEFTKLYHYALVFDDRLYLAGEGIVYIELNRLSS